VKSALSKDETYWQPSVFLPRFVPLLAIASTSVRVGRVFQALSTAYMVMDFEKKNLSKSG
jgi:hypothetical protein